MVWTTINKTRTYFLADNSSGGLFAQHPVFPFLVSDMEIKSNNRRISHTRMSIPTFQRLEEIVANLTPERLRVAEEDLKSSSRISDPDIHFIMKELQSYGQKHPLSNENRMAARNKIKSTCWKYGLPNIWFTINPNDLTNPVKLRLCMSRLYSPDIAKQKLADFAQSLDFIHDSVRDPVSSAEYFGREIECFFKHYVQVGQRGIFGKVSAYYGLIQTNERGALHLHGLMWLHGNIHLPKMVQEAMGGGEEEYRQKITSWIDDVFCEVSAIPSPDDPCHIRLTKKATRTSITTKEKKPICQHHRGRTFGPSCQTRTLLQSSLNFRPIVRPGELSTTDAPQRVSSTPTNQTRGAGMDAARNRQNPLVGFAVPGHYMRQRRLTRTATLYSRDPMGSSTDGTRPLPWAFDITTTSASSTRLLSHCR